MKVSQENDGVEIIKPIYTKSGEPITEHQKEHEGGDTNQTQSKNSRHNQKHSRVNIGEGHERKCWLINALCHQRIDVGVSSWWFEQPSLLD